MVYSAISNALVRFMFTYGHLPLRPLSTTYCLVMESLASHIRKCLRTYGVQYNKHSFKTTQFNILCFNFAQRFAVKRSYFINFYKFPPMYQFVVRKISYILIKNHTTYEVDKYVFQMSIFSVCIRVPRYSEQPQPCGSYAEYSYVP